MAKKRVVVIDGKSVFYRGYYAMPNLSLKDGTPMGGVYGFAVMALEVMKKMKPDYVTVAWDKAKTSTGRRTKLYKDYKANRKPAPADFYEQIPYLHELLEAFGWPLYEIDEHEADDIMGTFAKQAEKKGYESVLITSDHDVLQTIDEHTTVAILKKGLTNVDYYTPDRFAERYEMTPEQFIDYKSLRGDPGDNLPGVKGVGEKTAIQLIKDYTSLDGVYEHVEEIKGSLKDKLINDKEMAYLTKELVILQTDVPVKLEWSKAVIKNLDVKALNQKLRQFEFRTLLRQLPEHMQMEESEVTTATSGSGGSFKPAKKSATINSVTGVQKLALNPKNGLVVHVRATDAFQKEPTHVLLSDSPENVHIIDLAHTSIADVAAALEPMLTDKKVPKLGYDIKNSIKAFLNAGVEPAPVGHDVRVSAFMINSLIREQSLTSLAQEMLGYEGADLDTIPPEEYAANAANIVGAIWGLHDAQVKLLKEADKVHKLAVDTEFPVISVLARMEHEGISLDSDYLNKMGEELGDSISDLEQQIFGHANEEFNISSPVQLADVLFNKMELPTQGIKKTTKSYSTAASELDKLRDKHPIINLITEFREVTKLKSTYVDTLPKQVDDIGKLHTTFSLSVAPTGRLSSHDPNLQNIPVRTELGKKIRNAFVAEKGNVFVSADYSQFELRLAAVLAGDDDLIESFNEGLDIHTRTAAQVYGVAMEDVSKDQRRDAKVINFGILYGMSPHGLSVATGMDFKEAKDFIDRYFELRAPILTYLEDTKKQAKDKGFVETMFGRRRPTPDVKSSNFIVRQSAERAAINHPIQGTEADLMKMAMIDLDKKLDDDSKQLLQIHDSILVECPEWKKDKVAKLMKSTMENVHKLKVNLDVDVDIGKTWGDL